MDFRPFKKRITLKMEKIFINSKCKGDWKWKKLSIHFKTRLQKKGKKIICQPNDPF
jgi:hypothetical protein